MADVESKAMLPSMIETARRMAACFESVEDDLKIEACGLDVPEVEGCLQKRLSMVGRWLVVIEVESNLWCVDR